MATYNIYRIRIGSDVLIGDPVNYPTGSIVYVKWNDSTNNFQVDVHNAADTYVSTETSGPDLTLDDYVLIEYNFQFCSSSTLVTFTPNLTVFPYATKIETANSGLCATRHLCDLLLTEAVVTNASTATSNDGEVALTVVGDGSSFLYSLNANFSGAVSSVYPTYTFTGLGVGNYTAYVKDNYNCITAKHFSVTFNSVYNVRYRGEFDSAITGYTYKVDILERGFSGAITEVKTGPRPFVLTYQGETEDKYKQIIASKATIQLVSETDFYFVDLFTGDERQFLVKFYIDDGGGFDLEWLGYLLQQGYEEDYIAAPYIVTVIATDGLADLDEVDYSDVGDKTLLGIIAKCLEPTELGINIRSGVNIFETTHAMTASDDPLIQTYFDTYFLTEKSNAEVITEILKVFGARIYQSQAKWWIIRIEDSSASALPYREFTTAGVYSSNGTENLQRYIKTPDLTTRLAWTGTPLMSIRAGYKKVVITHDLGLENNLFYEGRFHVDDFNELTGMFNGIGVELGTSIGVDYGLENTRNGESDHCLFVDFTNSNVNTGIVVFTEDKTIESDNLYDFFKLSFDYFISTQVNAEYIRFRWAVALSGGVFVKDQPYTNHTSGYNNIYSDSFFKWTKYEKEFGPYSTTSMQVRLNLITNNVYDASTLAELETLDTDLLDAGERRIALDTIDGDLYLRHYTLEFTTDTAFSPDIIEPDDYATSRKKWMLDNTLPYFAQVNPVGFYLIDNLRVEYFPDGDDPEKTEVYEIPINETNKQPFEVSVIFGDLPDTRNAVHIYKNYFKLSNDNPTTTWARATIAERAKLLDILKYDMAAQNVIGIRLLKGDLVGDIIYRFHYALLDNFDSDRPFIPMGLEIDYRYNIYSSELIELKAGEAAEPPADSAAFTEGFSLGYRS